MRYNWILILFFLVSPVQAAWTGVGAFVGNSESDWLVNSQTNQADLTGYGLSVEEKSLSGIRIGARIGEFSLTLRDLASQVSRGQYDGQFLSLYMRWPYPVNEYLSIHGLFDYRFNTGKHRIQTEATIDWSSISAELGLRLQTGQLGIQPFVKFQRDKGDLFGVKSSSYLETAETISPGLTLDYAVERYAYIRMRFSGGASRSFMLSLVREY